MVHRVGHWFKSSYSGGTGTECVEVADLSATVGVRDSTRPEGVRIAVGHVAWAHFVAGVRARR
ncbi:DUF397 domain-containing protein [Streptomyces sp. NPDC047967]|uniref:DUF397 domain-containing protein n=1 Tax=unclassified Streptomyces TaxID=2593676 RepID=UPI0009349B71|nr:DUF397 domain-containing protein [Streptomyces sp. NBRC 110465]